MNNVCLDLTSLKNAAAESRTEAETYKTELITSIIAEIMSTFDELVHKPAAKGQYPTSLVVSLKHVRIGWDLDCIVGLENVLGTFDSLPSCLTKKVTTRTAYASQIVPTIVDALKEEGFEQMKPVYCDAGTQEIKLRYFL